MIGTITPLVLGANSPQPWLRALVSYAFGSVVASGVTGALLGGLGALAGGPWSRNAAGLAVVAITLSLLELGVIPRPRQSLRRSTPKAWRQRYGLSGSAFRWGADLGFAVTTRMTFASAWFLLVAAFSLASPVSGAVLMMGYGIGRTALVATGPLILGHEGGLTMLDSVVTNVGPWHRFHGAVLAAIAVLTALVAVG